MVGARTVEANRDIVALTSLRGIAALYVVLHHYAGMGTFSSPVMTFLTHGYLAVDLFFVLSGFVMAMNYKHLFSKGFSADAYFIFLGRRFARVYPIYLVTLIAAFAIIFFGLNAGIHWAVASPAKWMIKLFLNLLLVQSWGFAGSINDPAWSLSAEWAAYLLFPFLVIPCLFKKKTTALLSGVCSAGFLFILCAWRWHDHVEALLDLPSYHDALPVLRCLPEFTLGILAFRFSSNWFGRRLRSDPCISAIICLAIVFLLLVPKSDFFAVMLFPLLIISLASGAAHIPGRLLSSGLTDVLGRLSYSIYLIHTLFMGVITVVAREVNFLGFGYGRAAGVAAALILTFVFSLLSYTLVEVPGRKKLRAYFATGTKKGGIAVVG